MKWVVHSVTDVGLVRKENQDSIYTNIKQRLFIVADGMGGHQGGAQASSMAVQTLTKSLSKKIQKKPNNISKEDMQMACQVANQAIYRKGQKDTNLTGMGTTVCMFYICPNGKAYIANVGDSRLYMLKEDKMWLLTEDHNFLTQQKKANLLSGKPPSAPSAEDDILVRSVGFFPTVETDVFERQTELGDKYLICSDGLSGFVPDQEIHEILKSHPLQDVPNKCVQKALETGGKDNISVIVVEAR